MSALSRMSGQQCELPVTPRIKLQADERQAANTAECRVEHRAKRQTASLEPSAKPPWLSSIEPSVEPSSAKPSFELSSLSSTELSVEPSSAEPSIEPSRAPPEPSVEPPRPSSTEPKSNN